MMKYLQKLGKALMLPVAVLPICGILMGLGYALAPGVMGVPGAPTSGAAYTVGFLLVKAGGALIDNMAWLFAIGAAVGLADNDGTIECHIVSIHITATVPQVWPVWSAS